MKNPLIMTSMGLALFGFTLWTMCDVGIKYLGIYPPFQVSWVAIAASVCVQVIFARQLGGFKKTFSMPKQKLHILRGLVLIAPCFLAFIFFAKLPLSVAYAIVFTAPFITKIISLFLLNERIGIMSWMLTTLGFIGVLIVLRPGIVPITDVVILAFISTFFFSLANVMSRMIGEENFTWLSYNIYVDLFFVVLMAYLALNQFVPMDTWHVVLNAMVGIVASVGTIFVGKAFASSPSRYIAPLHYSQIIWGTIWGMAFFNEYPDMWTVAGSLVIITAGVALILKER